MISRIESELELIKKLYVNNGEYEFSSTSKADKFAIDLFWNIHHSYSSEGYHDQFETIEEFIHSHHADSQAYWLYEEMSE